MSAANAAVSVWQPRKYLTSKTFSENVDMKAAVDEYFEDLD